MRSLVEVSKIWEARIIDGKFPLRKWIGGSEYSSVFLTERSAQESQKAAIKLIPAEVFSRGHAGRDRAEEDAQLSRWTEIVNLSHPNLIRLYERGRCEIDGARFLYVVMEYAEEDLSQILPLRALTPEEAKEMLPPLAEALGFLHRAGLAHGRVKPSNIMAVGDQLKISADSLRRIGERRKREATVYDAAEIDIMGVSAAADVWSLGVMVVAVLTQHEPVLESRGDGRFAIPETIPQPFREIAERCLRADPRQRCSLTNIVSMLKGQVHAPTEPAENPAARPIARRADRPVDRPTSLKRSKRWIILPIGAALILLAVLFARRFMVQPPTVPSVETHPTETQPAPAGPPPAQSPAPFAEKAKPPQTGVVRGSVRQQVLPDISRSAQNTITGRVKVNVHLSVDASGKVSQAKLIPPTTSRYFGGHALDAAQRWKFNPPQVNGQPSPSEWILRFQFGRASTQVVPAEVKP
jgi:TonB family protein